MTVSGLVTPPVQNSSHSLSMRLRNCPVIICVLVFLPQRSRRNAEGIAVVGLRILCVGLKFVVVDDAFDAVFQADDVEVDQESHLLVAEFQI
jgi:hypothetical protein